MDAGTRYGAGLFNPNDRSDRIADEARKALVRSYLATLKKHGAKDGDDLSSVAAGLMVGMACVMAGMVKPTDESHAAIRSTLLTMAPWAVDMMRSFYGLPTLPSDSAPARAGREGE